MSTDEHTCGMTRPGELLRAGGALGHQPDAVLCEALQCLPASRSHTTRWGRLPWGGLEALGHLVLPGRGINSRDAHGKLLPSA